MLFLLVTTGTCLQVISNPEYARFTTKKGLAHNTVISVFNQQNGLVWATTMDGLSRIDATGIHSFQSQQYSGLTSNFLHGSVELDSTTFLLITRDAGFVTFSTSTNEFTSIQPQAGILPDGRFAFIKATFPLHTDNILAVLDNQQQVVFRKDGTVLESSQMPVYVEESSVFKLDTKKNQVLVLHGNQVEVLRIQSNGLVEKTSLKFDFHNHSAIGSIKSIEVMDNHVLLITEDNGLFLVENYSDGTS
jgi:ligand-binding sensor domain-containing protein